MSGRNRVRLVKVAIVYLFAVDVITDVIAGAVTGLFKIVAAPFVFVYCLLDELQNSDF